MASALLGPPFDHAVRRVGAGALLRMTHGAIVCALAFVACGGGDALPGGVSAQGSVAADSSRVLGSGRVLRSITKSVLYAFPSSNPHPVASLVTDASGNLYGTTEGGWGDACPPACGSVFELQASSSPGGAWTFDELYQFSGGIDGSGPRANLVFDANGNLYGTAGGGSNHVGVVFELSPNGQNAPWKEQVLYNFTGGSDGMYPNAGLIFDGSGALYGTTIWGGCNQVLCGTVFKLTPPSVPGGIWTESVLHRFSGQGDGQNPGTAVTFGRDGGLYGTTEFGGTYNDFCQSGCGEVFELKPPSWREVALRKFNGNDGGLPLGTPIFDPAGNLYGTTSVGISQNGEVPGTVFELSPHADGQWTEHVLIAFKHTGPESPHAGVIRDANGNLFGTTEDGGYAARGTAFELSPPKIPRNPWILRQLTSFGSGSDGAYPEAAPIFGANGVMYGTTMDGGGNGVGTGTVYSLTLP